MNDRPAIPELIRQGRVIVIGRGVTEAAAPQISEAVDALGEAAV